MAKMEETRGTGREKLTSEIWCGETKVKRSNQHEKSGVSEHWWSNLTETSNLGMADVTNNSMSTGHNQSIEQNPKFKGRASSVEQHRSSTTELRQGISTEQSFVNERAGVKEAYRSSSSDQVRTRVNNQRSGEPRKTVEDVLKEAALGGHTNALISLLEEGAPFVVDTDGQTVLHIAASAGNLETVEALLDRGCDANVQDFTGHTALQRACTGGYLNIVKLLLKQGVPVDHQDEMHGNTALHEASWKGFSKTVALLCKNKANVYMKNRGGFAPLHLCCQEGHNETCRILLINGCKTDLKNNYGDTPFHTAARYGHAGVIRILVSAKCSVSEQNKNGDTVLHIAAAMGRRKLTRILLESGCDASKRNKQGETAMDIAMRKNLLDIVAIFKKPPSKVSVTDLLPDAIEVEARCRKEEDGRQTVMQKERKRVKEKVRSKYSSRNNCDHYPSPYGDHDRPDLSDFSSVTSGTFPCESLKAGEQYYLDLGGKVHRGLKTRKPTSNHHSNHHNCNCTPVLEKIGKKIDKDRKEVIHHIDRAHKKLDSRLTNLEKKTRNQLFNFNQTMKETFAAERSDCQDRVDRRQVKERINLERQQAIKDIMLKRDLARWLNDKLLEIEKKHGLEEQHSALLRQLTHKKSRQGARAALSEIKNGTLRRAHSEELLSEISSCRPVDSGKIPSWAGKGKENNVQVYRGLMVSNQPSRGREIQSQSQRPQETRVRQRHNSEGDYEDVHLMQETLLEARRKNCKENPAKANPAKNQQIPETSSRQEAHRNPPKELPLRPLDSHGMWEVAPETDHCEETKSVKPPDNFLPHEPPKPFRLEDIIARYSTASESQSVSETQSLSDRGSIISRDDSLSHLASLRDGGLPRPSAEQRLNDLLSSDNDSLTEGRFQRPLKFVEKQANLNINSESAGGKQVWEDKEAIKLSKSTPPQLPARSAQRQLIYPAGSNQGNSYYEHLTSMTTGFPEYPAENLDRYSHNRPDHTQRFSTDATKLVRLPVISSDGENSDSSSRINFVGMPHAPSESTPKVHLVGLPITSDTGSCDSHNDSGYSTRLGHSDGPSPSLSGSTMDGEPMLDPLAINMIPADWDNQFLSTRSLCPSLGSENNVSRIRALHNSLQQIDMGDVIVSSKGSLV